MARQLNPQTAAANWASGMSAGISKLKAGVAAVTDSPMAAAANAADRMLAGVTAAVSSGKWAARLRAVPVQTWKDAMTGKGVNNISASIPKAQPKVLAFQSAWLPFIQGQVAALPPRGDLETNINRMTTIVRAAHGFNYTGT